MSSAKPNPKETTKVRQDRDKREYERLVTEIKHRLEHKSPGLWGWWDELTDTVGKAVAGGLEWINEVIDTYVWDTTENEAVVESWVRDTFNIPDQKGKGFTEEAGNRINEIIDTYVWDTTEREAVTESWVRDTFDIPDQEGKSFVGEAEDKLADYVEPYIKPVKDVVTKVTETVTSTVKTATDAVGDIINNISIVLGVGFDAAMAALAILPNLFIEWRADLANFMRFDIDEFMTAMAETTEKMKL